MIKRTWKWLHSVVSIDSKQLQPQHDWYGVERHDVIWRLHIKILEEGMLQIHVNEKERLKWKPVDNSPTSRLVSCVYIDFKADMGCLYRFLWIFWGVNEILYWTSFEPILSSTLWWRWVIVLSRGLYFLSGAKRLKQLQKISGVYMIESLLIPPPPCLWISSPQCDASRFKIYDFLPHKAMKQCWLCS